jgi:hypothetical protein
MYISGSPILLLFDDHLLSEPARPDSQQQQLSRAACMRCGGGEALVLSSGEHLRRHAQLTNCIPTGESSASGFLRDLSTAPLHQLLLQQGRWLAAEPNTDPSATGGSRPFLTKSRRTRSSPSPDAARRFEQGQGRRAAATTTDGDLDHWTPSPASCSA